jgi:hypothetical protein
MSRLNFNTLGKHVSTVVSSQVYTYLVILHNKQLETKEHTNLKNVIQHITNLMLFFVGQRLKY